MARDLDAGVERQLLTSNSQNIGQSQAFSSFGSSSTNAYKGSKVGVHSVLDTNRLEKTSKRERASGRSRFLGWWTEVLRLAISIILLSVIVAILKFYNGKVQPHWRFEFNLNALVALLATMFRITMMDTVTNLMGQLKWNWFAKPQKLSTLDAIDESTRGPWAAFVLFMILRKPDPLLLGGAIAVLSIAIGIFTQAALSVVPCTLPVSEAHASVMVRNQIQGIELARISAGSWELDWAVKSTVLGAFSGKIAEAPFDCPTGNCTFPSYNNIAYSTIGLCTRCIDTSSQIVKEPALGESIRYSIPSGSSILFGDGEGTYIDVKFGSNNSARTPQWVMQLDPGFADLNTSTLGFVEVLTFTAHGCNISQGVRGPTLSCPPSKLGPAKFVGENSTNVNVVGTGCSFYTCVKNYAAEISNGKLIETPISTIPALLEEPDSKDNTNAISNNVAFAIPCVINGTSYDMSNITNLSPDIPRYTSTVSSVANNTIPLECTYTMNGIYNMATALYFRSIFNGTGRQNSRQGTLNGLTVPWFLDEWWLASIFNYGLATHDSISKLMDGIATSYTNFHRIPQPQFNEKLNTSIFRGKEYLYAPSTKKGMVHETTICNHFNWPWLLYPAILLLATLILFLVTAVVRSFDRRHLPVWKSSLLPLLFYGFGRHELVHDREQTSGANEIGDDTDQSLLSVNELSKIASKTVVRFRRTTNGSGFERVT